MAEPASSPSAARAPAPADWLTHAFGPLERTHYRVPIPDLPAEWEGVRIGHFSDLHFHGWRAELEHLRAALIAEQPDLMAISGDVAHQPYQVGYSLGGLARVLAGLRAPLGIYAAVGNHDARALAYAGRGWRGLSQRDRPAGGDLPEVCWLDDQCTVLQRGAARLAVIGLSSRWPSAAHLDTPLVAAQQRAPGAVRIVIGHFPSCVAYARAARVEVVLSGHSHGGQYNLPGLGPSTSNDRLPRRFGAGLHRFDHTWLHVTRGVGLSGPLRLRIFCRPELAILTLVRGPAPPGRLVR